MQLNSAARAAFIAGILGLVVILAALVLQYGFGYAPCPLCLQQRWPYYIGVPIAFILAFLGGQLPGKLTALLLVLLAGLFAYGCFLGVYQAGAEWNFWLGPADCSAGNIGSNPSDVGGLLDAIDSSVVVSCTNPRLRILGVSLAGWNAVVMAVLVLITLWGASRAARRVHR
ncbi:disulfide bond formation protein B [Labrys miyagiensis]